MAHIKAIFACTARLPLRDPHECIHVHLCVVISLCVHFAHTHGTPHGITSRYTYGHTLALLFFFDGRAFFLLTYHAGYHMFSISKQTRTRNYLMFTTYIPVGSPDLGNVYAVAQSEDKMTAVNETISRANELFTDEFIAAKKPYKIIVVYPNGTRKYRMINE